MGIDPGMRSSSADPFGGSENTDLLGGNPFSVTTGRIDEGGDDSFDPLSPIGNNQHDPKHNIDNVNDPFGLSLDPFSSGITPRQVSHSNSSNPFDLNTDPLSNSDNLLIPTSDPIPTPGNPFSNDSGPSPSLLDLDPITPDSPDHSKSAESPQSPYAQPTEDLLGSFLDPISISNDLPSFADYPVSTIDKSSSHLESRESVGDLMSDSFNDQFDLSMTKSDPSISFSDSLAQVPDGSLSADENSISISDPCLTITESQDIHEEQHEIVNVKSPVEDSDPFSLSQTSTQKSIDQVQRDDPFGMDPFSVETPSVSHHQIENESEAIENYKGSYADVGLVGMSESAIDHPDDELSSLDSAQRQTSPEEGELDVSNLLEEEPVTEDTIGIEEQSNTFDHASMEGTFEGNIGSEDICDTPLPVEDFVLTELDMGSDVNLEISDPKEDLHKEVQEIVDIGSPDEDSDQVPSSQVSEQKPSDLFQSDDPFGMDPFNIETYGSLDQMKIEGKDTENSRGFDDDRGVVSISESAAIDPPDAIASIPAEVHSDGELISLDSAQRQTSPEEGELVVSNLPEEEPAFKDSIGIEEQSNTTDLASVEGIDEGNFGSEDIQDTPLPVEDFVLAELDIGSEVNVEISDPKEDLHKEVQEIVDIGSPDEDSDQVPSSQLSEQKPSDQFKLDDPFGMDPFNIEMYGSLDQMKIEGKATENSRGFDDDRGVVSISESAAIDPPNAIASIPAEVHSDGELISLDSAQRKTSPEEGELDVSNLPEEEPAFKDSIGIEEQSNTTDLASVEGIDEGNFGSEDIQDTPLPVEDFVLTELDMGSEVNVEISDPKEDLHKEVQEIVDIGSPDEDSDQVPSSQLSEQKPSDQFKLDDPFGMDPFNIETYGSLDQMKIEGKATENSRGFDDDFDVVTMSDSAGIDPPEAIASTPAEVNSDDELSSLDRAQRQTSPEEVELDTSKLPEEEPVTEDAIGIEEQSNTSDHVSMEGTVEGNIGSEDIHSVSIPVDESILQKLDTDDTADNSDSNKANPFGGGSLENSADIQSGLDPFGMKEFIGEVQVDQEPTSIVDDTRYPAVNETKNQLNIDPFGMSPFEKNQSFPPSDSPVLHEVDPLHISLNDQIHSNEQEVDADSFIDELQGALQEEEEEAVSLPKTPRNSFSESSVAEEEDRSFSQELNERELSARFSNLEEIQGEADVDYEDDFEEDDDVFPTENQLPEQLDGSSGSKEGTPCEDNAETKFKDIGVGEREIIAEELVEGHEVSNVFAFHDESDIRSEGKSESRERDMDVSNTSLFNREAVNYIRDILNSNLVDNAVDININNSGNRVCSDDEHDVQHSPEYNSSKIVYTPSIFEPNSDPLVIIQANETKRLLEKKNDNQNHVAEKIFGAGISLSESASKLDTPPIHRDEQSNDLKDNVDVAVASDRELEGRDIVIEESSLPEVSVVHRASSVMQIENVGSAQGIDNDGVEDSEGNVNYVADMLAKNMVENCVDIDTYQPRDDVVDNREDNNVYSHAISDCRPKIMETNTDPLVYIQAKETEYMFDRIRTNEDNHVAKILADDMLSEAKGTTHADESVSESLNGMINDMNDRANSVTGDRLDQSSYPQNEHGSMNLAKNKVEMNSVVDIITNEMIKEPDENILGLDTEESSGALGNNYVSKIPDIVPNDGDKFQAPVSDELNLSSSQYDDETVYHDGLEKRDVIFEDRDDQAVITEDVAVLLREDEFSRDVEDLVDIIEDEESGFKEGDNDDNVGEVLAEDITFEEGESMMSTPDLLMSTKSDMRDDFFQNIGSAEHSSPQGSDDEENEVAKGTFGSQLSSESDDEESRDQTSVDEDGIIDVENDWSPNDIKVELSTEEYTVNDTLTINKPCTTTGTPLSPLLEETEIPEEVSKTTIQRVYEDSTEQLSGQDDKNQYSHESYSEDEDWEEEEFPGPDEHAAVSPTVISGDLGAVESVGNNGSGVTLLVSDKENGSDAGHDDDIMDAIEKIEEEIAPSATNKTYDVINDDIDDEIEEDTEPISNEDNMDIEVAKVTDQSNKSPPEVQINEEVQHFDGAPLAKYSDNSETLSDAQCEEKALWNEMKYYPGVTDISDQTAQKTQSEINILDVESREEGNENRKEFGEDQVIISETISDDIIYENRGYAGRQMGDNVLDKSSESGGSEELHVREKEHEIDNVHLETFNDGDMLETDSNKSSWDGTYTNQGQSEFIVKDRKVIETMHASMDSESLAEEMPNADNTPANATSMHTIDDNTELDQSEDQESISPNANDDTPGSPSIEAVLETGNDLLEEDDEDHTDNVESDLIAEEVTSSVSAPEHSLDINETGDKISIESEKGNDSIRGEVEAFSYPTKWTDVDQETTDMVFPDLMVKDIINDGSSEEDVAEKDERQKETILEEENPESKPECHEDEEVNSSDNIDRNGVISGEEAKVFSYPIKWTDENQEATETIFPDLMVKDVINDDSGEENSSDNEQENVLETVASDIGQRNSVLQEQESIPEQVITKGDQYHVEDDLDSQQSAYEEEFSQEEKVPRSALVDKVLVRMLAEDMSTNEYVPSEDEMIEISDVSAMPKEEEENVNVHEIRAGNYVNNDIGELDSQAENSDISSEALSKKEITISSQEGNMVESSPSVSAGAICDVNHVTDDGSGQDTSQDLGDGVMDNSSSYDITVSLNDDIVQEESDAEDSTPANDLETETVRTQDLSATDASITDVSISEQETKSDGSSGQSYLVVEPYERFIISDIEEADEDNEVGDGSKGDQATEGKDSEYVVENWFNARSMSSEIGEVLTEEENRQKEAYEKWGEPLASDIDSVITETQMAPLKSGLDKISEEVDDVSSTPMEVCSTIRRIQDGLEPQTLENQDIFLQDKYFENSFGEDLSDADSNKTNQGELVCDDISEEREGESSQDKTEIINEDEIVRSIAKEYVNQVVMDAAVSYRMSSQFAMTNSEDIDSTKEDSPVEERREEDTPEATSCAIFEQAAEEYIDHVVTQDEEALPKITDDNIEGQDGYTEEDIKLNNPDETAPEVLVCRYTEPRETAMPFIMESGEDLEDTGEESKSHNTNGDIINVVPVSIYSDMEDQSNTFQEIVPVVENMPVTETALAYVMESEHYASSYDEEDVESDHEENTTDRAENGFDDDSSSAAQTVPQVRVTPALLTEESSDSEISIGESREVGEGNEQVGNAAVVEELIAPVTLSEVQTNPTNFYHLSNDEDEFDDSYSDLLDESKKLENDIAMMSADVTPQVDIHVSPAYDAAVIEDEIGSEFLPNIKLSVSDQTPDLNKEIVDSEEVVVPLKQGDLETLPSKGIDEESNVHGSEDESMDVDKVARELVNNIIKKATENYVESEEPSIKEDLDENMVQEGTLPQDGEDDVFEEYDNFDDASIPYYKGNADATSMPSSRDYKKTVSLEESLVAGNLLADSDDDGEASKIPRPTELPLLTASGQGLLTSPSKKSRLATSTPAGMSPGSILSGDTPVSLFSPDFESVTSTPGSLSDQEAEVLDTGNRLLLMSPFDKKSISVDESVTKNLEEEWDDKEVILNAIRAKQEEAERRNMQLEGPTSRQMSLDSEEAMRRMQGVSVDDEWQDDEYTRQSLQGNKDGAKKSEESDSFYRRPVPKDEREAGDGAEHTLSSDGVVLREKKLTRPNTLLNRLSVQSVNSVFSEGSIDLENISDEDEAEAEKAHGQSRKTASNHGDPSGARPKEKRKIRAELSLNLDDTITTPQTDDGTAPAILTPTSTEMSWEDDTPMNKAEPIEEYTAREEHEDRWRWRKVNLGGKDYTIDMKAINPYKKVLSHGGYYGEGLNAIIVFASCYLPEKSKKDYTYIMNNLFLYVVSTLELLVAQEYIIIYFHGSASRAKIPSLGWMRKCYQMIDRKLRKSLKGLYLVHPTTWLKAIVQLTKPFISHKFSNKLKFVKSLTELKSLVSMEYVYVPEEVKRFDQNKNKGGGTIWARLIELWLNSGWIAGPPPVDDEDWFSLEEGYDSDYSITADFLLSPHNPPNWHRRRQRKRLLIKAGHFNFSSSDEEGGKEGETGGRRHRRNLRQQHQEQHRPPTSSSHHEDESIVSTPGSIGINLGPAISPQDYLTEWYFKRRTQSCSGFIEDDTFSYNHIIATPEVERRTWKEVFGDALDHGSIEYDGEDEEEDADCCDGNSATESHGQLELSS
ncbi:uncharacterized protein LOC121410326 isoform X1 [Lytechinus variegatus]|uniref:uncharacterized protein LOC121410326 isoform X1 n=2 Tax=Lytechinus variegatus TaxID=7654 RepID=UPI001BB12209|nr:uncharacterized protein LOC121410326 isoform X1 [Lytechinus variegatus]